MIFEYKVVSIKGSSIINHNTLRELNELGAIGWEVISYYNGQCLLKRSLRKENY